MAEHVRTGVERREIEEADVDDVATLLSVGFPNHGKAYWLRGLRRQRMRDVPDGYPRYGLMLKAEGRVVGVLLMIYATIEADGRRFVRCNLSSWYFEPLFTFYSPLLIKVPLKDRSVTFVNISPAPHTRPIIEAQGFRAFERGWFLTFPWLQHPRERARVRRFDVLGDDIPERQLMAEHAACGCLCLIVETPDGRHPFVFTPRRLLKRIVPMSYLVYSRNVADFTRFAAPLGRALLRRGIAAIIVDPVTGHGLRGRVISRDHAKYYRGPNPPRPGDLSFTELALFG